MPSALRFCDCASNRYHKGLASWNISRVMVKLPEGSNPAEIANSGPSFGRWKMCVPQREQNPRSAKADELNTAKVSPLIVLPGACTAIQGPEVHLRHIAQWQTPTVFGRLDKCTSTPPHKQRTTKAALPLTAPTPYPSARPSARDNPACSAAPGSPCGATRTSRSVRRTGAGCEARSGRSSPGRRRNSPRSRA